jgi:hypothetical protein
MLMRTISNIMTILTTIVASPLDPRSQLVLLVSFEDYLAIYKSSPTLHVVGRRSIFPFTTRISQALSSPLVTHVNL